MPVEHVALPEGWVAKLVSKLDQLNQEFSFALASARSLDAEEDDFRLPAMAASYGVACLVQHLCLLPGLQDKRKTEFLQAIAMEFKNLADGMPLQFIRPSSLKKAPKDSHQEKWWMAQIALVIEVLIAANFSQAEATRLVAAHLNAAKIPVPRPTKSRGWAASTLSRWLHNFRDPSSPHPWCRYAYQTLSVWKSDEQWPPSAGDALAFLGTLGQRISMKISLPPAPMR